MAIQWPLVVDRLVAWLPTLSGWTASDDVTVFDGAAFDVSTSLYVTVGHSNDGQVTRSGTWRSEQASDGFQYDEAGDVACSLFYEAVADDLSPIRHRVFPLFNAVDSAIRADRRIGVLSQSGTAWLTADIGAAQTISAAWITVPFSINYQTTTL